MEKELTFFYPNLQGGLMQEASFRNAKNILREKGLLEECREIASSHWREVGKELGWRKEEVIEINAPERNLRPRYDLFKNGVAVSHEQMEQMRARWHLMKMEIGFHKGKVDVGVMIFPKLRTPSLRRTERELNSELWNKYFPLKVPIYIIEYTPE